jgi:hypothetical protein
MTTTIDCKIPCQSGSTCNTNTGICEGNPPTPTTLHCQDFGCQMLGAKCNKLTGKCEGAGNPDTNNVCQTQHKFSRAVYTALKDARNKDNKLMANAVTIYLCIHFIFLIWGVMLAFKSQPKQNRVVHITLAMVFGPAYVLSYYLNMI